MSQSVIGALRANLGLDSAQFERGARRSQSASQGLRQGLQRIAAVAGAVAGALTALTVQVAGNANEIRRLSQAANTAPETFQRWAAASATVGIEQQKLADILKDVNDRVGDFFATGAGPMVDFFENIAPLVGVTAEQFRGLSGPDALQLYIDSLQRAGVNQQDMTFYLEAMSSDLTLLLPLLQNGGAEMERLGQRAQDLGAVLDGRAVASLSALRAAMGQVQLVMQGVQNQIAVAVAPSLTRLITLLVDAAMEGGALHGAMQDLAAATGRFGERLATITSVVEYLSQLFVRLSSGASALSQTIGDAFGGVATAIGQALAPIRALLSGIGSVIDTVGTLISAVGGVGEAFRLMGAVVIEVMQRIGNGFSGVYNLAASAADGITSVFVRAAALIVQPYQDLFNFLAQGFNSIAGLTGVNITAPTAGFADSIRGLADEMQGNAVAAAGRAGQAFRDMVAPLDSVGEMRTRMAALRTETEGAAVAAEGAADAIEQIETAATGSEGGGGGGAGRAVEELADGMTDLQSRIEGGAGTLADFFLSFADGVQSAMQQLRQFALQLLRSGLTDLFAGVAARNGGGLFSTILSGLSGARANGGNTGAGMLYRVNETQEEFFRPAVNGEVVPLRGGGGGGGAGVEVNIINNAQGVEVQQGERGTLPDGRQFQTLVINTVRQGLADGTFDGSLSARTGVKPRVARR